MKTVFFGASKFVLPAISALSSNSDLALVVTTEKDQASAVPSFCKSNNIPFTSISKFDEDTKGHIKKANAALAALGYFGLILPKDVLNIFPHGILNIHPSLLPLYRGATPVQSAILNGDKTTGVTIIRLDEKMDHGPILAQKKTPINDDDTTETLHGKLFNLGAEMLAQTIPEYLNEKLKPVPQDDSKSTFTKLSFSKRDGYFDIKNPPSKETLGRMIRAYYPWPGAWTTTRIKNQELRIKLLPDEKIQVEGKKPIPYKDFFNGYPDLKEELSEILPL